MKSILSTLAGACTSQGGKGTGIGPFTRVVEEDVELYETYMSNPLPDYLLREIVEFVLDDPPAACVGCIC